MLVRKSVLYAIKESENRCKISMNSNIISESRIAVDSEVKRNDALES